MKDQVRKERRAGALWDVWVRQGILTADRPRGESPVRHWAHPFARSTSRQKRLNAMAGMIGIPLRRVRDKRRSFQ